MTDNTQSDVVEAILAWLRSDYAKGSDDWCDAADAFADYIEENILPRFASLSTKDDGLVGELEKALPLLEDLETGQDCEDYAYAKGKGFQAMTYCPAAFEALRCIPRVLTALRSDRDAVVDEERAAIVAWLEAAADERGKKTQDGWALHWAADRIAGKEHLATPTGEPT